MRIGMMADAYKPHVSGITTYIDLNKRALEEAGHEVYVFTFGDLDFQDDETRVIRSQGLPLADTGFYLSLRYRTAAKKLLQVMSLAYLQHYNLIKTGVQCSWKSLCFILLRNNLKSGMLCQRI